MSDGEPLSDVARALLAEERHEAPGASLAMKRRLEERLAVAVGAGFAATAIAKGALAASASSAASAGASAATATSAAGQATSGVASGAVTHAATAVAPKATIVLTVGKLAGVVVASVAVGAASGVVATRAIAPAPASVHSASMYPAGVQSARDVPPPPDGTPAAAPPVPSQPAAAIPSDGPNANVAPSAMPSLARAPNSSASAKGGNATPDIARERLLVDAARSSLAHGDAAAALDAIARHEQAFPRGELREERDALHVLALARTGRRSEAEARAAAFRRAYPSSVFSGTIDAALTE